MQSSLQGKMCTMYLVSTSKANMQKFTKHFANLKEHYFYLKFKRKECKVTTT